MHLRPATNDDAALLFAWTNNAEVRRWSFSHEPVAWDEHVAWLGRVLADPARRLFVAVEDGEQVGMVRLDDDGGVSDVSLSVAPEARGRGLAVPIIRAACALAETVVAEVIPGNERSVRAFTSAGFVVARRDESKVTMRWP